MAAANEERKDGTAEGIPVGMEVDNGSVGGHTAAEDNGQVVLGLPVREKSDDMLVELATCAEGYGGAPLLDFAMPSRSSTSDPLTLMFQGKEYVFHFAKPEKVLEALQLLEASDSCDEAPKMSGTGSALSCQQDDRMLDAILQRLYMPIKQVGSLIQFQDKRKKKCFDKKIHHTVGKVVALRCNNRGISRNATPVTRAHKGTGGSNTSKLGIRSTANADDQRTREANNSNIADSNQIGNSVNGIAMVETTSESSTEESSANVKRNICKMM